MNEWIKSTVEILAAAGTLWAAISAKQSASTSSKQLLEQLSQNRKLNRPRLVPHNIKLKSEIPYVLSDWATETNNAEQRIVTSSTSRFSIPVLNVSSYLAIDVKYSFKLEFGIDAITPYSNSDESIRIYFSDENTRQLGKDVFTFNLKACDSTVFQRQFMSIPVAPYSDYLPIVQPSRTEQVFIPQYFVILNNIFLEGYNENVEPFARPSLILSLQYRDQYNNEIEDLYKMRLSTKQITLRRNNDRADYVEAWIDFKFLKTSYVVTNE